MKKRLITAILISFIFLFGYAVFFFVTLKDDEKQIRDEVGHVYGDTNIVEIKMLDGESSAIVIFEWNRGNLGAMTLSKSLFQWQMAEAASERLASPMRDGVFYREFNDYTVFIGKVQGETSDINVYFEEVSEEFSATIVEDNRGRRFWYLITENDDLSNAVVKAYDEEGNVIAQMDEDVFNGARVN
ncbi:hypothetical protein HXA31_18015 [Salipaludibacillus agaradhaerens]|uniref:Uncharacterized protein n=1 Tax=Salipaludibacillus agaradhaerens TaxID=76935 RepID=A0A9Q4B4F0_SALAG|nr:hypothetical protein [Salipaludibacillus agaradhaerens]MCR6098137.1 hypothetical protein [Salipaludibacillus agaradhaerens]MCR6116233.1 hypothetical protein [Salipaludibacillus agaradhaerens]